MSGTFALEYAPQIAKDDGPYVIDNSSAFRYDDDIPLVVPEINASAIKAKDRLIANPNCTTAIAVMALYPLHQRYGIRRIVCSTYQVYMHVCRVGRSLSVGRCLHTTRGFGRTGNMPC